MRCEIVVVMTKELKANFLALNLMWDNQKDLEFEGSNNDIDEYFAVNGDDWKWYEGMSEFDAVMSFIDENEDVYCIAVDHDFQTLEWGNTNIKEEVGIEYDFKFITPFTSEGNKKYLLMDLGNFDGSDLSDLSDFEFELLTKKENGYIYTNQDDFVAGFNAEHFTTDTHQLRIVGI